MFIFNFVVEQILEDIMNWIFKMIMDGLSEFFGMMGNMGAELFEESWVEAIVLFFNYFGWAMFAVGLVVAAFECAIESQSGKGSIKNTALNVIKGFMSVSLVSTVPVELYKFCISLQTQMTGGMTSLIGGEIGEMSNNALEIIMNRNMGILITLVMIIMIGYCVIKVFFANLKRGGILLIQVGSRKFIYVQRPKRIYGWFHILVQADDSNMFYSILADDHPVCRLGGFTNRIAVGTWTGFCGSGSTKDLTAVWIRNVNERKSNELCVWYAVGSNDYQNCYERS